jgi:hypothetical protein
MSTHTPSDFALQHRQESDDDVTHATFIMIPGRNQLTGQTVHTLYVHSLLTGVS